MTDLVLPVHFDYEEMVSQIRVPEKMYNAGPALTPPTHIVFTPDLTAEELTIFNNLVAKAAQAGIDYSQLKQIRSDLQAAKDVLTTYYNLANPTAAQTAAATKKIIEVLNLFLRIFSALFDYLLK